MRNAAGEVVAVVETAGGGQLCFELRGAGGALFGHDIDDPACGATTVQRAGAGQHFDPLYVERRDAVELARQPPRAVLADAVDHHQHVAPAHVLAVVAAPFGCQVEPRHQFADGFLEGDTSVQLLLQLHLVDHPHGARDFTDGGAGTGADADFQGLELQALRGGLRFAQDDGARIAELPVQAAAFQQGVQCLFNTHLPFEPRAV